MTIFVGVFFLRWNIIFPVVYHQMILYIMPWYLILCGLMIGYVIGEMRLSIVKDDDMVSKDSILLKSFIIGVVIGLLLALGYIFL